MATLAVEHARRKHAAQLASVFGDLLHTVSLLRCKLAFDAPQSEAEMKAFTDDDETGLKTQLNEFYMQACCFPHASQSMQRPHHERVSSCARRCVC